MNPGEWRTAVEPVGQSIISEPKGWRTTVTPKGVEGQGAAEGP